MHEWALAEAVVEALATLSRESGRKLFRCLRITVGRLRQLDRDILTYAINEMLKSLKSEIGVEVEDVVIEDEDVVAVCNRCGHRWGIDLGSLDEHSRECIHFVPSVVHTLILCPRCGSHDYDIVSGNRIAVDIW